MKGLSEHFPQFSCRNLAITRHEHGTVACPPFYHGNNWQSHYSLSHPSVY